MMRVKWPGQIIKLQQRKLAESVSCDYQSSVVGCLIPSEKSEVAAFIIINWGVPATNLEELHCRIPIYFSWNISLMMN